MVGEAQELKRLVHAAGIELRAGEYGLEVLHLGGLAQALVALHYQRLLLAACAAGVFGVPAGLRLLHHELFPVLLLAYLFGGILKYPQRFRQLF